MPKTTAKHDRRVYRSHFEVRSEGGSNTLVGYAAVFDAETQLRKGLSEVVRPGAFTKTIRRDDIRALWNHSNDRPPLGRSTNGTLRLEEDDYGLRVEIDAPESAADVVEAIQRGDVNQMSFGFTSVNDRVTERSFTNRLRELLEVKLFDVSPVVFPAYDVTEISAETRRLIDGGDGEYSPAVLRRRLRELEDDMRAPGRRELARYRAQLRRLELSLLK